jgi:2,4-dienoyl-CoA reductase (NADPH2)
MVFFATGVNFSIPPIPGVRGDQNCPVCFADEALAGDFLVGKKVVIIGGAATGVETAIWASQRGAMDAESAKFLAFYGALSAQDALERTYKGNREVFLLELLPKIGASIGRSTRWIFMEELHRFGVNVMTDVRVSAIKDHTVFYKSDDEEKKITNVDTVIMATGVKINRQLGQKFEEYLNTHPEINIKPEIQYIGDSRKVGTILDAVHDGFKKAFRLGKAP